MSIRDDGPTQPPPTEPPPLAWAWCVQTGDPEHGWSRGTITGNIDTVYDEADSLLIEDDVPHATILLQTPETAPRWGVADRCDKDGAWTVGRARWKDNYAKAAARK